MEQLKGKMIKHVGCGALHTIGEYQLFMGGRAFLAVGDDLKTT